MGHTHISCALPFKFVVHIRCYCCVDDTPGLSDGAIVVDLVMSV